MTPRLRPFFRRPIIVIPEVCEVCDDETADPTIPGPLALCRPCYDGGVSDGIITAAGEFVVEDNEPYICDSGHQYTPERGVSGCPRCHREYQQGVADGTQYHADRMTYGAALAERFALDAELAAYNGGDLG